MVRNPDEHKLMNVYEMLVKIYRPTKVDTMQVKEERGQSKDQEKLESMTMPLQLNESYY